MKTAFLISGVLLCAAGVIAVYNEDDLWFLYTTIGLTFTVLGTTLSN